MQAHMFKAPAFAYAAGPTDFLHVCHVHLVSSTNLACLVAMQAPMFKAPAFAYATGPTDFLLVRHASGRMALRQFQGCVTLGQQEPHVRVPAPQSKEKR